MRNISQQMHIIHAIKSRRDATEEHVHEELPQKAVGKDKGLIFKRLSDREKRHGNTPVFTLYEFKNGKHTENIIKCFQNKSWSTTKE